MAAPSQLAADQDRCRDEIKVTTSQLLTRGREGKQSRKRDYRARERKGKGYRNDNDERERGLLHV